MRQELAKRDFALPERLKSEGIPDVFLVFQPAPAGQKIHCPAEAELFSASLEERAKKPGNTLRISGFSPCIYSGKDQTAVLSLPDSYSAEIR